MGSPTVAIMDYLKADATVTTVATGKIRCGVLEPSDPDRSIVICRSTQEPLNHSTGTDGTKFAKVAVQCLADTYHNAETIADAVEAALETWTQGSGSVDDAITSVKVLDVEWMDGPAMPAKDKPRQSFIITVQVDYTE